MACSLSETIYSEAFDFVPHGTETISYWSCMIHNIAPYEAYLKKKKKKLPVLTIMEEKTQEPKDWPRSL